MSKAPARITVYLKPGCSLCDEALEALAALRSRHDFEMEIVDISSDPSLRARLRMDIPVVAFNGERLFRHRVDVGLLERMLTAPVEGDDSEA